MATAQWSRYYGEMVAIHTCIYPLFESVRFTDRIRLRIFAHASFGSELPEGLKPETRAEQRPERGAQERGKVKNRAWRPVQRRLLLAAAFYHPSRLTPLSVQFSRVSGPIQQWGRESSEMAAFPQPSGESNSAARLKLSTPQRGSPTLRYGDSGGPPNQRAGKG